MRKPIQEPIIGAHAAHAAAQPARRPPPAHSSYESAKQQFNHPHRQTDPRRVTRTSEGGAVWINNMLIRPATADDVPAVLPMVGRTCALHEQWDPARYGFLPDPQRMYSSWLISRARDQRSVFMVAERESSAQPHDSPLLVGFIVGTVEREIGIYRLKEYGFLHDLWVEPDYRNEGIARQLTMLALERFRQIGVQQVRLDVASQNDPARRLFESCGFRPSTLEMLIEFGQGGSNPFDAFM